jgi:hypothetical protein
MTVSQTQCTAGVTSGWEWTCDLIFIDGLLPAVSYFGSTKTRVPGMHVLMDDWPETQFVFPGSIKPKRCSFVVVRLAPTNPAMRELLGGDLSHMLAAQRRQRACILDMAFQCSAYSMPAIIQQSQRVRCTLLSRLTIKVKTWTPVIEVL